MQQEIETFPKQQTLPSKLCICLPISNHKGWWAGRGAFLPRVPVLARAKELHLCALHSSSKSEMVPDSSTTSHSHSLAAWSLAESSSRSSCPDRAGSCLETWQAARAAERPAAFSLHSPLTRNPDVPGHSFLSLGTSHLPAAAWISLRSPQHIKQPTCLLSSSAGMSI